MAEQTHGNKQVIAQERYLEELKESDAYLLLKFAYEAELLIGMPYFRETVVKFLNTGIRDRNYDVR